MRLNLGEVALCLGCGPGMVIWDGPNTGPDNSRLITAAPLSMKGLAQRRAAGVEFMGPTVGEQRSSCWEDDPWTGIFATGAQVDSREVQPGNLFFCLPGEKVDGHDFALDAARAGASAIIAERNPFLAARPDDDGSNVLHPPVFLVDDVCKGLWRLAMCHRDTSLARVIGITGTAGKTSVKEVLAQVLEVRGRTERNPMNKNNQIGLPVSMLNASADASFWVMELGISEPRDMDELGQILRPDLGLILNVGEGHLAGLGDLGVAAYKARLLDYILPGGLAAVSNDYPELNEQVELRQLAMERRGVQTLRFSGGASPTACHARYLGPGQGGSGQYRVCADETEFTVDAPFRGEFGNENVAAIVALAAKLGLSPSEIKYGFSLAELPKQRFRSYHYAGFTLLDDSYNANPLSANRMVRAAADMARENGQPLVLVMGEMLELGDRAPDAHTELGLTMAAVGPEIVFWKGGQTEHVLEGLKRGGYARSFHPVADAREFAALVQGLHMTHALVLFKGSRGNRLEELVGVFRDKLTYRADATLKGEAHAL